MGGVGCHYRLLRAPDSPEPPPPRVITVRVTSLKASSKLPLAAAGAAAIFRREKELLFSKYGTYF